MAALFNVLIMLAMLAIALYAQWRLPFHTATRSQALLARGLLILVGLGVGWVAVLEYGHGDWGLQLVAFLTGFGLVHLPAAFILWSKRLRGVNR